MFLVLVVPRASYGDSNVRLGAGEPKKWTWSVQSILGFATMVLAANLDIATTTSLTDLPHYIIATMGVTTSHFRTYSIVK